MSSSSSSRHMMYAQIVSQPALLGEVSSRQTLRARGPQTFSGRTVAGHLHGGMR